MKGLIFVYLMTYGGALISLFNPFIGLLIYVSFAILRPDSLWQYSVPQGNYSRIVAVALLLGWAMQGFGNWRLGRATLPMYCLIGYFVWSVLSSLFCQEWDVGYNFVDMQSKIVLPVVVGLTVIRNVNQIRQLAWVIVLSMGYVAYDLNMSYFEGFNRLEMYGHGSMDNNCFGIALVTSVGFSFFLGLTTTSWLLRLLAFASAAFCTHAVLFSFSRGAMVALVAVAGATFFLMPRKPFFYALYALGVVVGAYMAGPEVLREFNTSFAEGEQRDWSANSRIHLWTICLKMTLENPAFGVGPNHYPLFVDRYYVGADNITYFPRGKEAHTLWLQMMAEIGIPGVLMLLNFYLCGFLRLRGEQRAMQKADPFLGMLPSMVGTSLAGFLVSSQFVTLEGLELPYYIMMCGLAGLSVLNQNQKLQELED